MRYIDDYYGVPDGPQLARLRDHLREPEGLRKSTKDITLITDDEGQSVGVRYYVYEEVAQQIDREIQEGHQA